MKNTKPQSKPIVKREPPLKPVTLKDSRAAVKWVLDLPETQPKDTK